MGNQKQLNQHKLCNEWEQLERNPKENCDISSSAVRKGLAYGITRNLLLLFLMVSLLMGVSSCGKAKKKRDAIRKQTEMLANEMENGDTQSTKKKIKAEETHQEMQKSFKPKSFPKKGAEQVNDLFKEGDARLNSKIIKKLIKTVEDLKTVDKENPDEILASLQKNGYNDISEYTHDFVFVATCFEALRQIASLDELLTHSDIDLNTGEGVAVVVMTKIPIEQTIAAGELTLEDVKAAYKNWDLMDELMRISGN